MAGHSKWANIKHRKERSDAKKGKVFSRLSKEIISAVKQGGPDPKANPRLRMVIQKAKVANLPNDNIERNIKKASSTDQADYFEMTYEFYGHGGVGIIADVMTDNKNRIASEMRIATNKKGGTIATPGSVSFNFERKGVIRIEKSKAEEDDLFMLTADHGADDFLVDDDIFTILSAPENFDSLKETIESQNIEIMESAIEQVPKTLVTCDEETANSNMALIEWIEGIDDVDAVFHNMEIS